MSGQIPTLRSNFLAWVNEASLAEIVVLLDALQDELLARRAPAAALVAQAAEMVRRQAAAAS